MKLKVLDDFDDKVYEDYLSKKIEHLVNERNLDKNKKLRSFITSILISNILAFILMYGFAVSIEFGEIMIAVWVSLIFVLIFVLIMDIVFLFDYLSDCKRDNKLFEINLDEVRVTCSNTKKLHDFCRCTDVCIDSFGNGTVTFRDEDDNTIVIDMPGMVLDIGNPPIFSITLKIDNNSILLSLK